jgi:tetratricopeptide (TPR) repeat protein/outer membrane receptor protein involved in Fe transport
VQWVTAYAVEPLRSISLSGRAFGELEAALAVAAPAERGRILADLGRWQEAEALFRTPAANGFTDPLGAGFAALRRGRPEEAQTLFDRVNAANAGEAELLALGRVSLSLLTEDYAGAFAALTTMTREGQFTRSAAHLLLADLMLFAGNTEKALAYLNQGLERFPGDARLFSALSGAYLFADERDRSREAIVAASRRDPRSPEAALAAGNLARIEGDGKAAARAYGSAIALKPGDDRGWYGRGRVDTDRENIREGRSNLQKALELNPRGAGYQGELGTLESFANNFAAARSAFESAMALNPDDYVALTGHGLLDLKQGKTEAALERFLRAGLMEPRYARAHVYAGIAYYQMGLTKAALEELARASQLDGKDPLPHFLKSIIHTDAMNPGLAIESSRRALQLLPNLKSLNQLANDQQGLTNLGHAFAFLGMEEWALRYAQDSYYPFWAGSHLFLADRYPGMFNKNSELFQGFLADPTVFGGSNRLQTLLPKPGHNFSASMRVTSAHDLVHGTGPQVQVSGFDNAVVPFAYFVDHERFNLSMNGGPLDQKTTTVAFGLTPRHDFGMFVFADRSELDMGSATPTYNLTEKLLSGRADLGLHYKLSPDSQIWFKAGEFSSQDGVNGALTGFPVISDVKVRQPEWGVRHTFDAGNGHEVSWGAEQGRRTTSSDFFNNFLAPLAVFHLDYDYNERSVDAYLSDRWQVRPGLLVQGDLFYQRHRRRATYGGHVIPFPGLSIYNQESHPQTRFNPRVGLAYRFDRGPQVRLAYQRWLRPSVFSSLGPVATAGIPLDDRLVMRGGELSRLRGQVEWEYSHRSFFTAHLDYKKIDNNRFSLTPFALNELESLAKLRPRRLGSLANDDMLEFANTPEWDGGRIRTGGISVNHLLTDRWGLFGRHVATASRNSGDAFKGNRVPYLPRHTFALGATWVDPGGWYFIGRMVHRSSRYRDEANTLALKPGWSGAFDLYWQSKDRMWLYRLSADNAFDRNNPTQYTAEINIRF